MVERRAVLLKMTKLGEELPKISRACVNNTNSLPSLYNNVCFECEIINKHRKCKGEDYSSSSESG